MKQWSIAIMLGLMLTQVSFAMQLYKGRVLEDKSSKTGSKIVSFQDKESKIPQHILKIRHETLMHIESKDGVLLMNEVPKLSEVSVGESIDISGTSEIYIENFVKKNQIYNIGINFCVHSRESSEGDCILREIKVELEPEGIFQQDIAREVTLSSDSPDMYGIVLATLVDKPDGLTYFATYRAGTLYVNPA